MAALIAIIGSAIWLLLAVAVVIIFLRRRRRPRCRSCGLSMDRGLSKCPYCGMPQH